MFWNNNWHGVPPDLSVRSTNIAVVERLLQSAAHGPVVTSGHFARAGLATEWPRMPSLPVLHSARRIGSAVVALLVLLAVSVLPVRGAEAAGWPSVFHAYGRFDGVTFNDPLDQPAETPSRTSPAASRRTRPGRCPRPTSRLTVPTCWSGSGCRDARGGGRVGHQQGRRDQLRVPSPHLRSSHSTTTPTAAPVNR